MKELTIQEKAQRYDEAIKVVKDIRNGKATYIPDGTPVIEAIFPELKESEDERIRKALRERIINYDPNNEILIKEEGISQRQFLAWLEKQGQTFTKKDVDDAYLKGVCDTKQELEKQGGQKPAEEVNGEDFGIDSLYHAQRILEKTLGKVDGYQSDDGILEHKCAITAVKKLYEQKPWSEEDENRINRLIAYFEDKESFTAEDDVVYANWLKSLKDRVGCEANCTTIKEWSEEDEQHIDSLLKRLDGLCRNEFERTRFAISEDRDFLKSLKQRYTWKPSNEQMDALLVKIPIENSCNKVDNILKSLYYDLKKLIE